MPTAMRAGGFGNGVGNDTGTEPDDAATHADELAIIFGVGGAEAVGCWGAVGAGNCGGWSKVGAETIARDAEAMDGALLVALATCSVDGEGIENTDDDPGVVKLVELAAAEDEAGADVRC